jgi:hypothetical protein
MRLLELTWLFLRGASASFTSNLSRSSTTFQNNFSHQWIGNLRGLTIASVVTHSMPPHCGHVIGFLSGVSGVLLLRTVSSRRVLGAQLARQKEQRDKVSLRTRVRVPRYLNNHAANSHRAATGRFFLWKIHVSA